MNLDEMVLSKESPAQTKRGLELRRRPQIHVGGLPTVSLLPREIRAAARDRTIRRALVGAVVVALVVAGGSTAAAAALASAAQTRLNAENSRSQTLLTQLATFADVQALQRSIAVGKAGVAVGSSTEIDWQAQFEAIEGDMPAGFAVTSITADSASAIAIYQQGTTPLELPRAATVTLNVAAPTITQLPIWLRKLRSIPAYADATASVASNDTEGYSIVLTIHLSPKALITAKAAK